jgi:hypothetical protein
MRQTPPAIFQGSVQIHHERCSGTTSFFVCTSTVGPKRSPQAVIAPDERQLPHQQVSGNIEESGIVTALCGAAAWIHAGSAYAELSVKSFTDCKSNPLKSGTSLKSRFAAGFGAQVALEGQGGLQ